MSQAPNPFTQAASQGYGQFQATLDDEEEDHHPIEEEPEGPQSPEPEQEEEEEQDQPAFTQSQERSYPAGIESPDEEEGPSSPPVDESNEQQEDDEGEEAAAAPSSPPVEDSNEEDEDQETNRKQSSQQRRRVQIMNDSDNDDDEPQQSVSTSVVSKEKKPHFLKQFTMKNEESSKKLKKRHSDEHPEKQPKRFREHSNNDEEKEPENIEATSDVEDVVDDIFGKDVKDNEEEGEDQAEVAAELAELNDDEAVQQDEEEEEEEDPEQETFDAEEGPVRKAGHSLPKNNIDYDIDLFLEKRAEQRRGNRRRGGRNGDVDLGPDSDRFVSQLIGQMKIATEEDRVFNKNRQPATAKLRLLPIVEQHLCRADLKEIFLDNGVLTVFKDWLSPLPDSSLPNSKIRESLIKILQQFGVIDADPLRDSSIGKALMFLYKHPRETKENKIKLIKIIHDWARPIFNLDTDYKHLTREQRQKRDADQASLKRQTSLTGKPKNRSTDMDLPFANNRRQDDDDDMNRDDDCPRARVPRPSNRDYVVRPVSTIEYSEKKGDGKKKTVSRLDEIKRRQQDRKRLAKPTSIVKLSIEGNKMHL